MVAALGFDYTTSLKADSPAIGAETYEVMSTAFQEEGAVLETLTLTVFEGSTPEPARSDEGHGLSSSDPSHWGGFDFYFEEVESGTMCVKDE